MSILTCTMMISQDLENPIQKNKLVKLFGSAYKFG